MEASCHRLRQDSGALLDHINHGILQISVTPTEQCFQRSDTEHEPMDPNPLNHLR
jgi:hypothetical protein